MACPLVSFGSQSAFTMGMPLWLVGVIISIVGSVFSNFGQNVQKFAMVRRRHGERRNAVRASFAAPPHRSPCPSAPRTSPIRSPCR